MPGANARSNCALVGLGFLLFAVAAVGCGGSSQGVAADPQPGVGADLRPSVGGAPAGTSDEDALVASAEPGWPQWRGPRRDGISPETGLLPTWPAGGPKLLWKYEGLGQGWSSPIVVGDRLYITGDVDDDLVVFAFGLDGRLQWRATHGKAWKGQYPGARATCAYSEGRLYHMNAHGRVACFDAESGQSQGTMDVLEEFEGRNITWGMSECLLVDGPRLIVTPGGKRALMAALDKRSGKVVWTTEPLGEDRATYASPILFRHAGRRLLASCSSSHGFGVDADSGKLLWSVPLRNQFEVNASTPIFGDGKILCVTAYFPGACYRLQPQAEGIKAEKAWTTPLDCVTGTGVLVNGTLYASGYRTFKSWAPIDWASGQKGRELKELTTGAAIYADGRLYCLAEDGRVGLLKPSADGLEVAGQFQLVPGRVHDAWAHPVLLGARLYLRYHQTLWCYDVKAR